MDNAEKARLPRVHWRDKLLEGETETEYQRLVKAAVPYIRQGKSLLNAVRLAQEVLPPDRHRTTLQAVTQIPPELVKQINRAVEDSLNRNIDLPTPAPQPVKLPKEAMDALEFQRTHRCPEPPPASRVTAEVLQNFFVGLVKKALQDPVIQEVILGLIPPPPKPQSTWDKVTQGTQRPEHSLAETIQEKVKTAASNPEGERKPIVLIVGMSGGEQQHYERELPGVRIVRWNGKEDGKASLRGRALTADHIIVNLDASAHSDSEILRGVVGKGGFTVVRGGTTTVKSEVRRWAKTRGIEIP